MKRSGLFALIALALSGVGAAQAQDFSNWYIAPRLGVVVPDSDRDTQSSAFTGIGIGWWVNPNFAVDAEYSINNADFKNGALREGHEWESVGLGFSGRYFFGEMGQGWRPYVMGGVGALRHAAISGSLLGETKVHGWDPMLSVGGGLQYNLSDRVAFRGELAARWDRDNSSRFATGINKTSYVDAILSAGLAISFGGETAVAATNTTSTTTAQTTQTSCKDLDDDKDGVNNCDDRCPATPAGTIVGPDGCPQKVVIELRGVNFKFDRPTSGEKNITPTLQEPTADSIAILDQAVDTLKRYPGVKVEVDGHTDSIGTDEYNQSLSERRARIVFDYLTSHGIDASRLDGPKGFGESKPVDTNSTKEGRARNRRTELSVEQ
jgi:OOP family OmpA-OmpF porin